MSLEMEQVIRMQVQLTNGVTWENRSSDIPDTDEARQLWGKVEAELAEGRTKGWIPEVPKEIQI